MVERSGLGEKSSSEMSLDDQEIPLYENSKERQHYDEMANLYSIILATEHLERAYARDAVDPKTYTEQCKKLISQFGVAEHSIRDQMSTETFMSLYQMDCPRAVERLLVQGVRQPIKGGDKGTSHAATVAETVGFLRLCPEGRQVGCWICWLVVVSFFCCDETARQLGCWLGCWRCCFLWQWQPQFGCCLILSSAAARTVEQFGCCICGFFFSLAVVATATTWLLAFFDCVPRGDNLVVGSVG